MEACALELRQGTARSQGIVNGSLMRLRSDEQLVELFRAGYDDAFCAIHERYRKRLLAYAMRMLNGSRQDAEDALQDVFERAYRGLRAHHGDMALRAWLYRVAHNRCLDELRRSAPPATVDPDEAESRQPDPLAAAEQHEKLRRLIVDIGRLPDQQRSALLLREMSGMSYAELAGALGVSVPAVKSLLVRARIGLAAASEARDTACLVIREELVLAHDRGARPGANVRRHLRDCSQCRHFRRSMRSASRNLAAFTPVLGPIGFLVKLLGGGGGATGSGGGAALGGGTVLGGGGLIAAGGTSTAGVVTAGFAVGGASHVTAIVAAALMTAGGAVGMQSAAATAAVHRVTERPAPVAARAWSPQPASSAPAQTLVRSPAAPEATAPSRARSKTKPPSASSATSTPAGPTTSGSGSASTATGSSATTVGATTSASTSVTTVLAPPATASGATGQAGSNPTSATSSSGTGSQDSTTGSTGDSGPS